MLNGANLALIAFSRMWGNGDGQIFALIVMVVAACEVTVGLGMIVAMYRRRLPIDRGRDAGAGMTGSRAAVVEHHDLWLAVLAFPLAGRVIDASASSACRDGRRGGSGRPRSALAFLFARRRR